MKLLPVLPLLLLAACAANGPNYIPVEPTPSGFTVERSGRGYVLSNPTGISVRVAPLGPGTQDDSHLGIGRISLEEIRVDGVQVVDCVPGPAGIRCGTIYKVLAGTGPVWLGGPAGMETDATIRTEHGAGFVALESETRVMAWDSEQEAYQDFARIRVRHELHAAAYESTTLVTWLRDAPVSAVLAGAVHVVALPGTGAPDGFQADTSTGQSAASSGWVGQCEDRVYSVRDSAQINILDRSGSTGIQIRNPVTEPIWSVLREADCSVTLSRSGVLGLRTDGDTEIEIVQIIFP